MCAFAEPPEHGIFEMSRLVLGRNMLVTQLSPHRHDLGEPFDRSVPLHNSCRHDRDILCDQPRIEAIVLGQHAAGAGELTKLARVDTSHRQSRREQGTDDPALVTTARLKANRGRIGSVSGVAMSSPSSFAAWLCAKQYLARRSSASPRSRRT